MKNYKKSIIRSIWYWMAWLLCCVFMLIALYQNQADSHLIGFFAGLSSSVGILMLLYLWKALRILRSEERLKKSYIESHDERNLQIDKNTNAASFRAYILFLALVVVVMAFVDMEKSILLSYLLYPAIGLKMIFYFYYKKKL